MAVTKKMLSANYQVAMLDIDRDTLESSSAVLNEPERLVALHCDVADQHAVDSAVAHVAERFGQIDALVNNAGIAIFKPFMETTVDEWQEILAVNLTGAFHCSQAAVPHMHKQGRGSIVNITSISGGRASTLRAAYGTSKAALRQLSRQMAVELGNQGIRVNSIAPGPVDTAMAKKVHSQAIRADYHDAIPLNRYGTEEEIADVVLFLCGDQSTYVNGQEIGVDGGFSTTGIGLQTFRDQ